MATCLRILITRSSTTNEVGRFVQKDSHDSRTLLPLLKTLRLLCDGLAMKVSTSSIKQRERTVYHRFLISDVRVIEQHDEHPLDKVSLQCHPFPPRSLSSCSDKYGGGGGWIECEWGKNSLPFEPRKRSLNRFRPAYIISVKCYGWGKNKFRNCRVIVST
jgi:hypothetical protein